MTQALTGQPVLLDPVGNVESIEQDVVFRLRDRREPVAPYPVVPGLPD